MMIVNDVERRTVVGGYTAHAGDLVEHVASSLFGVLYPQLRARFEYRVAHLEPRRGEGSSLALRGTTRCYSVRFW